MEIKIAFTRIFFIFFLSEQGFDWRLKRGGRAGGEGAGGQLHRR